ncbi:MAG: hypothetical protein AAGJ35_03295 [Myxococcota bacterium]
MDYKDIDDDLYQALYEEADEAFESQCEMGYFDEDSHYFDSQRSNFISDYIADQLSDEGDVT